MSGYSAQANEWLDELLQCGPDYLDGLRDPDEAREALLHAFDEGVRVAEAERGQ